MRKRFEEIFRQYPDLSIEPIHPVKIGGVQFGPGARFGRGVLLSGFDLTKYTGREFEVDEEGAVWKLKGVY